MSPLCWKICRNFSSLSLSFSSLLCRSARFCAIARRFLVCRYTFDSASPTAVISPSQYIEGSKSTIPSVRPRTKKQNIPTMLIAACQPQSHGAIVPVPTTMDQHRYEQRLDARRGGADRSRRYEQHGADRQSEL